MTQAETVKSLVQGIMVSAPSLHRIMCAQVALISAQEQSLVSNAVANEISEHFGLGLEWDVR